MLALRGITLAYGPKVIQHDLSFDVRRGSIFAVMGGSGCGKSTVLKAMIGLLRPSAGTIPAGRRGLLGGDSEARAPRSAAALRRAVPERRRCGVR